MKNYILSCRSIMSATLTILAMFLFVATIRAEETAKSIPPLIQLGFEAYASEGPEAAVKIWTKGSYCEGENYALSGSDSFKQNERFFGEYKSFEVLASRDVGKNTKLIFLSMNFTKGAIFSRFQLYKTDDAWIMQDITWKHKPEEIMPWLLNDAGN